MLSSTGRFFDGLLRFRLEEFDDLMDGQGHMIGILEGVVGIFDGIELDDVIFGKLPG